MTPTDEQERVREGARGKDSLMVEAFAGCAKTTTLEMASKEIKVPGLALAFNKSIKEELGKRFPGNFSVQTMNGLGFASLRRGLPGVDFKIDDKKAGKLVTHLAKEWKLELSGDQWMSARDLWSRAMLAGIVPGDLGSPLTRDTRAEWAALSDDLGLTEDDFNLLYEFSHELLVQGNNLTRGGVIGFDDQVYYSTCVEGRFPQFPVLLVDEAQDLSPLNHAMLAKAMRPDGRLIVCGDARQAIYAFRGADTDSIGKISRLRSDWAHLPLTLTFRCPKVVVDRQQSHAPGFRAAAQNKPGTFHSLGRPDEEEEAVWDLADFTSRWPSSESSVAILCRNNAPLLSMAFKLIRRRVSVVMLGRDIGAGLVALSRKLFPEDSASPDVMRGALDEWAQSETSKAIANGQEEKVDAILDKVECLRAVMTYAEVQDARSLRLALRELFAKDSGRITLSSIHKAKGLEWDVVMHLDPWRIPSKWAKDAAKRGDDRQLVQERNLKYVLETRTRDVLVEANMKEFI